MHVRPRHLFFAAAILLSGAALSCKALSAPLPTATPVPPSASPAPATDTLIAPTHTPEPSLSPPPSLTPSPTPPPTPLTSPVITIENLDRLQVLTGFEMESSGFFAAALAFSPAGNRLAAATDLGELKVWDLSSGELAHSFRTAGEDLGVAYPAVAFSSPDGRYLAATSRVWLDEYGEYWGAVKLWDFTSEAEEPRILTGANHWSMTGVSFSPDGGALAASRQEGMGGGGSVKVWEMISGEILLDISSPDRITSVDYSSDGRTLAGSSFGIVILWDASSGVEMNILQVSGGPVWGAAFSPDGHLLAARGGFSLYLVNPENGHTLFTLDGLNEISSMVFSPGGRFLVAGDGSSIRIWDVTTGDDLIRLETSQTVVAVAFSPDGRVLASLSADGVMDLWGVR